MSHYISNLRDIRFNLFELHRVQDYLGKGEWADLDEETANDILVEIERIAREEYAASYVDQDRIPLELVDGEVKLPESVLKSVRAYRDGGWDRVGLPRGMGGHPAPPTVRWSMAEMLLAANTPAQFYAGGALFARALYEEGTDEQKELARLWIDKDWGGTMVLTEPDAGSDVGAGTAKAVEQPDGTWHIEGVKRFITGGEHNANENIIHLTLARPDGAGPGTKGLSLFVVPKFLVNEDGSLGARNGAYAVSLEKKMGIKGSTTCEMAFGLDDPAVGYLVGGRHDGIRQMFRVIEDARMMIGTKAMGTLSTGYLNALRYAQDRVQGADLAEASDKTAPRARIIGHPDVRRMLMEQKACAEGLRALVLYTAWVQDQIILQDDDMWRRRNDLLLPMVKGYSSERAYELLASSLQVFGGAGYTQDYPIEQYIRDAKIDTIYEGATGIQALDLFFRKIARDQGAALAALAAEIVEFVKSGPDDDPLAAERVKLGRVLDGAQSQLGSLVEYSMGSLQGDRSRIYKVGLQANGLLESLAETVISWLLLRQAEIAIRKTDGDPFYLGKTAAARWFLNDIAPRVAARREAAADEDGALMDLPVEAF